MTLSIIDLFDIFIDNINQTIQAIQDFITQTFNILASINNMLTNEMRSILVIAIALIQLLIIYNFVWGRK